MPTRIVIVGAGPAGALLAYLLASRGGPNARITLIERQDDFEREFRGEVLMPSGIDALRQAGLEAQFARVPQNRLVRGRLYDRSRFIGAVELGQLLGEGVAFTAVSQPAMLEMLVGEASKFHSFHFERGVAVRELVMNGPRAVGVAVVNNGVDRTIDADLVIGADGRSSLIRRKAGLEIHRNPQSFDIVWCKLPAPPPALLGSDETHVFLGRGHFSLAFQTYDGRLQLAWVIRKGAIGELRRQGTEQWVNAMADHVTPALAAHLRARAGELTHPFLLDVICDLMPVWTKPGLLLIGDAAHPMSPVGGQGINIAMRDAIVAANHLVPLLSERADHEKLDAAAGAIQRERFDEVATIQRAQQLPPRLLFRFPWLTRLVTMVLPRLLRTRRGGQAVARTLSQFTFGVKDVRLRV